MNPTENTNLTAEDQRILDELRYGYAPHPAPAPRDRVADRRRTWAERTGR